MKKKLVRICNPFFFHRLLINEIFVTHKIMFIILWSAIITRMLVIQLVIRNNSKLNVNG